MITRASHFGRSSESSGRFVRLAGLTVLIALGLLAPVQVSQASVRSVGAPVATAATAPGSFVPVPLTRLLNTQTGYGTLKKPLAGSGARTLQIGGRAGVPTSGVSAVVLSATAITPAADGSLVVYSNGTPRPGTTALSWAADRSAVATVTTAVSANGRVDLYNASGSPVDLVVDIEGYYLAGTPRTAGAYVPLKPSRSLDTRSGVGASRNDFQDYLNTALTLSWQVAGRNGVPATGVSAVVMSVSGSNADRPGRVAVSEDQQYVPALDFNGNFFSVPVTGMPVAPGVPVTQQFVVNLSAAGKAELSVLGTDDFVHLDVVADVVGYYRGGGSSASGMYQPTPPMRVAQVSINPQRTSTVKVDAPPFSAVQLVVDAEQATAYGALIAYEHGTSRPTSAQLKIGPGRLSISTIVVRVGADSTFDIFNQSQSAVVVNIDQYGFARGAAAPGRTVWSWGLNHNGQLAHGVNSVGSDTPAPVLALSGIKAVTAADSSGYAIKPDGSLWAWGKNSNDDNIFRGGQLGNGTSDDQYLPVQVSNVSNVVQVVAAYQLAFALQSDGTVWSWGEGTTGESGDPTDPRTAWLPVRVAGLSAVVSMTVQGSELIAVRTDGTVWSLANAPGSSAAPLTGVTGIRSADGSILLRNDGRLQIGTTVVAGLTDVVAVSGAYATKADGTLWSFNPVDGSGVAKVAGLTGVTKVGGAFPQYALTSSGALWQLDGATTPSRVLNLPPLIDVAATGFNGGMLVIAA